MPTHTMPTRTDYTVTVELDTAGTDVAGDAAVTALTDYHPAAWPSDHGHLTVAVTLPAEGLHQAVTTAVGVITTLTGHQPLTVEAAPTALTDARAGIPALPDLIGVSDAARILGVSRQRVLQLVDAGTLPAQQVGRAMVLPRAAVEARAVTRP